MFTDRIGLECIIWQKLNIEFNKKYSSKNETKIQTKPKMCFTSAAAGEVKQLIMITITESNAHFALPHQNKKTWDCFTSRLNKMHF